MVPVIQRLPLISTRMLAIRIDGISCEVPEGDTLLTAILAQSATLKPDELAVRQRGGFCLMGACQDCWVRLEDGGRVRACSTYAEAGMRIQTALGPADGKS